MRRAHLGDDALFDSQGRTRNTKRATSYCYHHDRMPEAARLAIKLMGGAGQYSRNASVAAIAKRSVADAVKACLKGGVDLTCSVEDLRALYRAAPPSLRPWIIENVVTPWRRANPTRAVRQGMKLSEPPPGGVKIKHRRQTT